MAATSGTDEPVSGELVSVAHALSLPAESYGNDPDIEMAWAMRAMQHAEVYYKLISSVDPQFLKLTKVDDQIYSEFRKNFETLRIDVLDPEELKSESAKEPPGYNSLPLKLLGTGKAITKLFISVFRTKKERKESTMEEKKELTVEKKRTPRMEERKELIVEKKKRKESTEKTKLTKEEKKGKKLTKKSTKVVKKLCKVYREQHSRSYDSIETTSTMVLLAQTPLVKCKFLYN
ncbi:protein PBDC1 isoform X2 [Gorilla gorilla gorilla]|uniref:Polysaccharide biosynthesis domain containing 1 n=1 Tax=Gorilla gorilla gorilla TaxID=9595 RepID=A0A2I2YAC9_GORGO|nr:protein PBDC1 isoform X2 [Gorilla gorilla gorilla]